MAEHPVPGACLCGAVRFTITPPTLFCAHCHCTLCRRAHGAGYVTWAGLLKERFAITAGGDQLTQFRSSTHGTRSFCRVCGSGLFFTSMEYPDRVDVVLANLQGSIDRVPEMHVFFDDRAQWVSVADGLPRFGGVSGFEPLPAE